MVWDFSKFISRTQKSAFTPRRELNLKIPRVPYFLFFTHLYWTYFKNTTFVLNGHLGNVPLWEYATWGKGHFGNVSLGGCATLGMCQLGNVPLGESAIWGMCHMGDVPLGGCANWEMCHLGTLTYRISFFWVQFFKLLFTPVIL